MDPAPPCDNPTERWRCIVAEVAAMPSVVDRLTAEHTPDRHGRCRVCTVAGQSVTWPCTLAVLAVEATQTRAGTALAVPAPAVPAHQSR